MVIKTRWMHPISGGALKIVVCLRRRMWCAAILLAAWCRVLLEKLTGLQLVKKFPAFHGTRRFITALTSVRHLSLSWTSLIQSIYPHPTSWRSILILSTHLRQGLPSGLFPSGFPSKTLYTWCLEFLVALLCQKTSLQSVSKYVALEHT